MIALAVCTLAACSDQPTPVMPGELPGASATAATAAGSGSDQSLLAAVRRATAKYHDVDKAIADGYLSPVGGHCEESPEGGMGIHSANLALVQDLAIDPEKPEVLLYLPTGGGNFRLIGVEYFQTLLLRNTETGAVAPWFSPEPWPAHYQVVNAAPSVLGQVFDGPMPGHNPGMPWHYDLHVWAWAPNPAGTFSMWNPSISCP